MTNRVEGGCAVTTCLCGCGTIGLHFFSGGQPISKVIFSAEEAFTVAKEMLIAAKAASDAMPADELIDSGNSEARH